MNWNDIAFQPGPELTLEVAQAWNWLIGDVVSNPVVCSRLGDFFFEDPAGVVQWLSCPAGMVQVAAPNRASFDAQCRDAGEEVDEWFGPGLINSLYINGKIAGPAECYAFAILPIFLECRYEPDNFGVVPVREVFVGLSDIHQQILNVPNGGRIKIKVV